MTGPRVIVTNDDGIDSPGLRRLAESLAESYDVVVAAPASDMSGSGTGIGRFDPGLGVEMTPVEIGDYDAYRIAGPPGLAVMGAALGAFGRFPDMVISGVNAGVNTGHSIIHSGTVGAALTARTFRIKGLAVSLAQSDPWQWDTAVTVAVSAVRWMLGRQGHQVLNVNVPAVAIDEVNGAHWADLDEFGYFRVANAAVEDERLQFVVGPSSAGSDPASDTALCEKGYVTVTPLSSVEPAPFPDVDPGRIVGLGQRGHG
jgi:5'-nucleotidase